MLRLLLRLLVLALVGWLVMVVFLFILPRRDHPRRADAIVVLSGDAKHRLPPGLELARKGVAPVLVVSDGARSDWAPARELCAHPVGRGFEVVCFRPRPYSTRGEARALAVMAERRHWRSLLVVTSTFHVFRSRMLFKRCLDDRTRLYLDGTRSRLVTLPVAWASETAKLVLAETLRRGC
jgi:uncharacterized SAM-binding protein YcdF (DUF218 family)